MKKQQVLIVEDEPLIANDLKFLLEEMGIGQVLTALDYEEALTKINHHQFDLALLDINLSSDKDGVDLAKALNEQVVPFIFITSYFSQEVVNRAKKTNPRAYLLKPFNKNDVRINVEMALFKCQSEKQSHEVYLKEQKGAIRVDVGKLLYLEAVDNYTKLVFKDREELVSQTLRIVHEKLSNQYLVRTHKSFCVKMDEISMIKGNTIFIDNHQIPIGRTYKQNLLSELSFL